MGQTYRSRCGFALTFTLIGLEGRTDKALTF